MTPDEVKIIAEVDRIFKALAPVKSLITPTHKGNRYELFLYLFLAKTIKWKSTYFKLDCRPTAKFKFKCSPTKVNDAFSFCSFKMNGTLYELRNGIEFQGHTMTHEIDISISNPLKHDDNPDPTQLRVGIECKYHQHLNDLKGQLRGLIGTVMDLSPYDATNHYWILGGGFSTLFASQHPHKPRPDFVNYLRKHNAKPLFDFHPAGKDMVIATRLMRALCAAL